MTAFAIFDQDKQIILLIESDSPCAFKTDMAFSLVRDRHIYEESFIVRNCAEGEI